MISVCFQAKPFNITVMMLLSLCPTNNAEESEVDCFYENLQDLLELIPIQDVLFIIGNWTGHNKHPPPTTQEMTLHMDIQMVNTKIRLIIFFAAENGEALYSQQKQDRGLTVAQIMNSLLKNSDLN